MAIGRLRTAITSLSSLLIGTASHIRSLWLDALHDADDIDARLQAWESRLTGRWRGRRRLVYHRAVEVYDDIQVAKVWNQARCAHIALHECIIEIIGHIASLSLSGYSPDGGGAAENEIETDISHRIQRSGRTIATLVSGICESIPFHLQQIDPQGEWVTPQTGQTPSMKGLGGEHLLWPLEVVCLSPWSIEAQRMEARKTLEEIGGGLGWRRASRAISRVDAIPSYKALHGRPQSCAM